MKEWYVIDDIEKLDSPQLVVYPDRVKHNIELAIKMTGGTERLRPHIKTHKTAEVIRMMLSAGINKFKCATISEAALLANENAADVLLAYQPVGPKAERLLALIKQFPSTKFSCLVDHSAVLHALNEKAKSQNIILDVFVDINVGMNRTGIKPEGAEVLYLEASSMSHINIKGLHVYDGHFRDKDFATRKEKCDDAFLTVERVEEFITDNGLPEPVIIAGGSPTFPIHAQRMDVECSPGTFVFWDHGYGQICKEQEFLHASLLITRVISKPADGRVCTDMGHKSIAAENEIGSRAYFLNAPELKLIGQSEEHGIVDTTGVTGDFEPGTVLYVLPYHICPTVNLHDQIVVVEDHHINGKWKVVARDREVTN
ncbi:MAG: D-TA family PLP-dependent enzyme [Chitinophagaceae bacterium]